MEPGFYVCGKCGHRWSRQEYKLSSNPPRECPACKDRSDQRVDQQRESDYTRDTYGGFVKALFGSAPTVHDEGLVAPGGEEVQVLPSRASVPTVSEDAVFLTRAECGRVASAMFDAWVPLLRKAVVDAVADIDENEIEAGLWGLDAVSSLVRDTVDSHVQSLTLDDPHEEDRGGGKIWDPCFEEVLAAAHEVGVDVSLDWTPRGTEVRTTVEGGCVVSVSLVPASVTCKLSFRKKSPPGVEGFRVELEASGPTSESCRDAALSTLRAHGLLAPA